MKRYLGVLLVVGLVVSGVSTAEAGKKKKAPAPYTTSFSYTRPALGSTGVGLATEGLGFSTNATHNYVDVKITDTASPTPYIGFSWDTDGDGVGDTGFEVCGTSAEDISVPANVQVTAFPWALGGPSCPGGFSTEGTVELTFSATP
jgi:hypothetical protein